MLFKIENVSGGRSTHCGVLEFVAQEGHVYLPRWVRPAIFVSCHACMHAIAVCVICICTCPTIELIPLWLAIFRQLGLLVDCSLS